MKCGRVKKRRRGWVWFSTKPSTMMMENAFEEVLLCCVCIKCVCVWCVCLPLHIMLIATRPFVLMSLFRFLFIVFHKGSFPAWSIIFVIYSKR